jgi:FkbM family methyltransferase
MENYEAHQKAITNSHSTRDFFIDLKDKWNSTASLLENGWNSTQLEKTKISVETLPFSEILGMKPDLIKMDIEGVEQSLVKANSEILKYCREYIIEFHKSTTQDLKKFLKFFTNAGFVTRIVVDKQDKDLVMVHSTSKE